jgi:hypothetical protein
VSLTRPLSIALLLGAALLGAGAAFHPMLPPEPENQLRLIAATWYFRPVHLAMLTGSGLLIVGVWTRALIGQPAASPPVPLLAALGVIALGLAFNAIDIAFMGGAGTQMAQQFMAGRTELAATFDALHMVGLMTARFGNFLVALGALVLGWVEHQDPTSPRWLAWLAWIAGLVGLVCVLFFREASLAILAAVTLLPGWAVVTALRGIRDPGSGVRGAESGSRIPDSRF